MKKTQVIKVFFCLSLAFASYGQKATTSETKLVPKKEAQKVSAEISTPDQALLELKSGNQRFLDNKLINTNYKQEIEESKDGQHPHSIILSCIDSRVPPEIIFDQGIGHIFVGRVAGNIIDANELGSLEFATAVKHSKLIVVLGHSKCGAIEGAVNDVKLGNLTQLLDQIKPEIVADSNKDVMLEKTTKKNVEDTIQNILNQSPVINELVKEGKVKIVGAYEDVNTGKVTFL